MVGTVISSNSYINLQAALNDHLQAYGNPRVTKVSLSATSVGSSSHFCNLVAGMVYEDSSPTDNRNFIRVYEMTFGGANFPQIIEELEMEELTFHNMAVATTTTTTFGGQTTKNFVLLVCTKKDRVTSPWKKKIPD